MKVLQLSKYYEPVKGGIELVTREISKAYKEHGHKVSVVAFSEKDDKRSGSLGEDIWNIKQDLFFLSTPMNYSFLFEFRTFLEKEKFDRIYVHLPNPFMHEIVRQTSDILTKLKTKVIAVYHSDILNKGILGEIYHHYLLSSMSIYQEVICSSENLKQSSLILSSSRCPKSTIIPFCVEERDVLGPELSGKGEFLSIGRMVPYKGFEFLIRVFNDSPYKLKLIGGGPLFKSLKKLAGPNISFLGDVSDQVKTQEMRQADALIVSSNTRAEAYGMTIVEAFQMGLPVVATKINTGVTYLVRHGETGLLYDINDSKQFRKNLDQLVSSPDLMRNLSKRGREFYHEELRFELFQKKLLAN